MRIFKTLDSINNAEPCAIALGLFDGLHKAHQAVIQRAVDSPFVPAVFTFSIGGAAPASKKGFCPLMTEDERIEGIESLGAQLLLMPDFSEIADLSAEDFVVDILFGRMNAKMLCCGYDFRFGRGNSGDIALLERLCSEHGAELCVVDCVTENGTPISSSAVRTALAEGDVQTFFDMVGRRFSITSEVVHGNRLGRTLSFPTVNQPIDTGCVSVRFGVYVSVTVIGEKRYPSITNVGVKPTVSTDGTVVAETNILRFDGDLYGKNIRVELMEFIRDEQRFDSVDELREAIAEDLKTVEKYFEL